MKTIEKILLTICVLTAGTSWSQVEGNEIIKLKNGEQVVGIVIEQKPGQYIRVLESPSGDTIKIMLHEIDRMMKNVSTETEARVEKADTSVVLETDTEEVEEPGFNQRNFYMNLKGMTGGGDFASTGFGLTVYRTVLPELQAGLGIHYFGLMATESWRGPQNFLPLSLELRYAFQEVWNGRGAFVAGLGLGYNIILNGSHTSEGVSAEYENGLYVQPSLGFRINFTKNTGLLLDVSYQNLSSKSRSVADDKILRKANWSNIQFGASLFF